MSTTDHAVAKGHFCGARQRFTGPPLCRLQAHEMVKLLKKREVSPSEALSAALTRIEQVEPLVNAMPTLCIDRARAAILELPRRRQANGRHGGWLAGLPIGIKDLTAVAGVRTTMGSRGLKDVIARESDPLVELLEARGAIIVGKTNTPEMGAGGNTFNDVFGITRNPWNVHMNAGGSSGGAAVSLATGEVWLSHGSDLAGSLRTPAAYCGVIGLRPSPGRAGGAPQPIAFNTEGVQGPMARTVMDTALFLDAMAGYDARIPISIEAPRESFQNAVRRAEPRVRIAYSADLNGFAALEQEIDTVIRGALRKIEAAGAMVEDACPALPQLESSYLTLRAMLWAALAGRLPADVQAHYKPTLRENIEVGRRLTAEQIYDAQRNRSVLYGTMHGFLAGFDVLACPTVGCVPGRVEEEYPVFVAGRQLADYIEWLRFSFLATTTGLPALSLPVGFTEGGMPVGLQLIGPPRGEAKLLGVASIIEQILQLSAEVPIDPQGAN
jgi:amidase